MHLPGAGVVRILALSAASAALAIVASDRHLPLAEFPTALPWHASQPQRLPAEDTHSAEAVAVQTPAVVAVQDVPSFSRYVPGSLLRGAYGSDSSRTGYDYIAAAGFDTVEVGPYSVSLDQLWARGLRGFVWLGGWDNYYCAFEYDDERVRTLVSSVAGHPALRFYYIGDEPYFGPCPNGPAAFRARTALIHAIDGRTPTYTVIAAWDEVAQEEFPYAHWVGTVDILGLDVYPCSHGDACDFALIDRAIARARQVGVLRYYAVLQAFEDNWYRMPTPAELQEQFARWQRSSMEGYLVFSWDYAGVSLDSYPELVADLQQINSL